MPVVRPKKPSAGRRKSSAKIPRSVTSIGAQRGAGSKFVGEHLSPMGTAKPPTLAQAGLPLAWKPPVATTPDEIRQRALGKNVANRRRSAANNVTGYIKPGMATQRGRLPTAAELLAMSQSPDAAEQMLHGDLPTAEDLLRLTSEQAYASTAIAEGTYLFPQVSPTKTINPDHPRTEESGWERITDPNHPAYPGILRVRFRDGTPWEYYNVPGPVWQRFKRVASPGRFINRVLNSYPYGRGDF